MDKKEVRDILLGRIIRQDEQFWMVAPSNRKVQFYDIRDGALDVRLFGVTHRIGNYQITEMEPAEALFAVETALNSMGHPMRLVSMPEAKACLYMPYWIAPVLLTVEQDGDMLQITAYTGRSLLIDRFRCRIALWILERKLPEGIVCIGNHKKADANEEKKTEKREASEKKDKGTVSTKEKKAASARRKK